MESFVPFGGFFSTPSDFKSPLNGVNQSVLRCHQCNEKCDLEIAAISKGGSSIADQCRSSLPAWLQMTEPVVNKGSDLEVSTALKLIILELCLVPLIYISQTRLM